LFWTRHHDDPCETLAAREDDKIATEQEHRRLLYVALTRAEERLYIMGAGKVNSQSWYDIIHTRLADTMQSMPAPWNEDEIIWRARHLEFAQESSASAEHEMIAAPLPAWIHASAPRERVAEPPISPSSALAAADQFAAVTLSADELAERALFGRLMHVLVQYLPQCAPDQRAHAARFFVDTRASSLPESMREDLYRDALALFDDADMNALFAHPQKAEVALAGKVRVGEGHHINVAGQIDLLIDTPTDLVIVDFKTGIAKDGDATPEVYAAQLGLYRRLLLNLYPSRTVRCMLVWTSGPKIVDVPVALLEKALTKVKQA
jgi:ATP-dependent helicase/nuclease subunit A